MKLISMFLLLFIFSMGQSYSQKQETDQVDLIKQEFLANMQSEDAFVSDNKSYALMPEIKAINQNQLSTLGYQYQADAQKITTIHGESDVVEHKGNFVVFEMKGMTNSQLSTAEQETMHPVVLNLNTHQYGILLGEFIVKVEDLENADQIAADYNLTVLKVFSRLNLVAFKNNDSDNILDKFSNLKADGRIDFVHLDILEHVNVAM